MAEQKPSTKPFKYQCSRCRLLCETIQEQRGRSTYLLSACCKAKLILAKEQ